MPYLACQLLLHTHGHAPVDIYVLLLAVLKA